MKMRYFIVGMVLLSVLLQSGCGVILLPKGETVNAKSVRQVVLPAATQAEDYVSMREYAAFLANKAEHYPISDEFIEKYQQLDGGYIELAEQLGIPVNRQLHSPNQKWHFFESWLASYEESNTTFWEGKAQTYAYGRLLCPELLLWMYEASGVDPAKVKQAMQVAVDAKENGTHISTMAKNMRSIVTWEDILAGMGEGTPAESVTINPTTLQMQVGESLDILCRVEPSDASESPTWTVTEGKDLLALTPKGTGATVTALGEGTAKVTVAYNPSVYAECVITITDVVRVVGLPDTVTLDVSESVTLTPALNKGECTFLFTSSHPEIATVSSGGVVVGVAYGETCVTVQSVEDPTLAQTVSVVVKEKPTIMAGCQYRVVYDQGGRVTAKLFDSTSDAMQALVHTGEGADILTSVEAITYIYGGASGGRNDTAWHTGDVIKFGTTSVNGSMTFGLSGQVNYVKITGYVYDNAAKIQVGDSTSLDWSGEGDGKTTLFTCTDMNEASKEVVEGGQVVTVLVVFDATTSVTIATTNKKPLFVTSIEFGLDPTLETP